MNHNKPNQGGTGSHNLRFVTGVILIVGALVLSACGGGADNPSHPQQQGGTNLSTQIPTYDGPPPKDQDTLYFYKYLWNNLRTQNHCLSCHDVNGQGKLPFADSSDVNAAYDVVTSTTKPLVDLANPAASRLVTKFSQNGHFCLDGSNQVCATELTNWITAWANAQKGGSTTITLTAPAMHAPAPPLNFPAPNPTAPSTYNAVYNLVTTHCVGCHVPKPTLNDSPVSPEFAITQPMETSGGDAETDSYILASTIPLINIADPEKSRFYTRLAVDGHNCWTDCPTAAAQMLTAIKAFTDPINQAAASGSQTYLTSGAVNLFQDGIVASGGGRYEADQIALYNFKVGSGHTILDVSGIFPAMNLTLSGTEGTDYKWMSNWGIEIDTKNAKAQALTSDSAKLQQLIGLSQTYSIETWVAPANTAQDMATIVSYDGGSSSGNNFSLNQNTTNYEATGMETSNLPLLSAPGLTATLQHVVMTYSPTTGKTLYINGSKVASDNTTGGTLNNWGLNYALVLGNNLSFSMPWLGQVRMLAIHNAALTDQQVTQNFDAGVGQKYFLLFNISQYLGTQCNPSTGPSCFIMMQATIFDNYSYLFSKPKFINLNDGSLTVEPSVYIKGLRIGVNGTVSGNGQVFSGLDICVNGSCTNSGSDTVDVAYTPGSGPGDGALLSRQSAVIAMQNGPKPSGGLAPDMIFLTFDQINGQSMPFTITSRLTPAIPSVNPNTGGTDVLIHTFDEINASLSALTGIPQTNTAINDVAYPAAIQALPSSHDPGTYNAASQMAVNSMAKTYCEQLIGNTAAANAMFPGINFNASPALNFIAKGSQGDQDLVIEPLLSKLMGVTYDSSGNATNVLQTMPLESTVHDDLATLMTTMAQDTPTECSSTSCSNARTLEIIQGTCTAAVASAPMLLH